MQAINSTTDIYIYKLYCLTSCARGERNPLRVKQVFGFINVDNEKLRRGDCARLKYAFRADHKTQVCYCDRSRYVTLSFVINLI